MKFKFIDSHKPILKSGVYKVEGEHSFLSEEIPSKSLSFAIAGPQFKLDPALVFSMYPPQASKGDFSLDLPSLVLNRSTLPWERSPVRDDNLSESSWLYLFVVYEDELKMIEEKAINSVPLENQSIEPPKGGFPKDALCLSVPKKLIDDNFPSLMELHYLSYARIQEGGEEKAVLLANRLPKRGGTSHVFLISIENRFNKKIKTPSRSDNFVFPLLYKWSFYAQDNSNYYIPKEDSIKLILGEENEQIKGKLYKSTEDFLEAISRPKTALEAVDMMNKYKVGDESFHGLLKKLKHGISSLSLKMSEKSLSDHAKNWIDAGAIPVSYESTEVETAWYHGPLSGQLLTIDKNRDNEDLLFYLPNYAANSNNEHPFLPQTAKSLLLFDKQNGLVDTSYSAAWQIGRLLVLNDKSFVAEFCKWKVKTATRMRQNDLLKSSKTGPIENIHSVDEYDPMPEAVKDKFESWKNLRGIPLPYLIPRQDLIPKESLRYFSVDHKWVNSLLTGAFSIGNTVEVNLAGYLTGEKTGSPVFSDRIITGFVLNSKVISGWPDFQVTAFSSKSKEPLKLLRRDLIAGNVSVFLYEGVITNLNFSLHQSKTHSGVTKEGKTYFKKTTDISDAINSNGKINIIKLRDALKPESIADFAKQMLETSPVVEFNITI